MKPPLDPNCKLASQIERQPPPPLFNGVPLLGFRTLVAPINKVGFTKNTGPCDTPLSRNVHKLSTSIYASAKMAPSLGFVIRSILEKQQISPQNIENYLEKVTSISRYDSAFRLLWAILAQGGGTPLPLP